MTLPDDLFTPTTQPNLGAPAPRTAHRHRWITRGVPDQWTTDLGAGVTWFGERTECFPCGKVKDPATSRRGKNNRLRGNAAELVVARNVGGRKVGPLGHPWDVEMPGYARLQVRKLETPPSLRKIIEAINAIGGGAEMPGYIWIEPGRGGERLIVFRLRDFAERHGVPTE